ncbi:MAG: InlB B-repeat-containing protein [Myxococcota bacterium]
MKRFCFDLLCAITILFIYADLHAQESGVFYPKLIFMEDSMSYLSVYSVQNTTYDGIYSLILDRKGNKVAEVLLNNDNAKTLSLAYLKKQGIALMVYNYCTGNIGCYLQGQLIKSDGSSALSPFTISSNAYFIGDAVVIADEDNERFLVVWYDGRNRSAPIIYGNFVNSNGRISNNEVVLLRDAMTVSSFDIVNDVNNSRFALLYSKGDGVNNYGVYLRFLDKNLNYISESRLADTTAPDCNVSITFNNIEKLFFAVFTDYVAGIGAYNIKGLIIGENAKIIKSLDITNDSFRNKNPDTAYNPYSNKFILAFQKEELQNSVSNIVINTVSTQGAILSEEMVDSTEKASLYEPSIVPNTLCDNLMVVFVDVDPLTYQSNFDSKFSGELCSFLLNIYKTGDGDGRVTSEPAGIDCGGNCSKDFADGELVKLIAIPSESSLFVSYTGTQCVDEPLCSVVMDSEKKVGVEFTLRTFQITTVYGEGGKILPENPSVKYGSNQTFEILPNTGYSIEDVVVDDISVGKVSSYTFTNVDKGHTISAKFVPYLNEWDIDGGVTDSPAQEGIPITITETGDRSSGCGCGILE